MPPAFLLSDTVCAFGYLSWLINWALLIIWLHKRQKSITRLLHKYDDLVPSLVLLFDFAVDFIEPVNRRSAESQAEEGEKVFERSEFFSPRLDCHHKPSTAGNPAKQGGEVAERLFAYFLALQKVGRTASEAGGAMPLTLN